MAISLPAQAILYTLQKQEVSCSYSDTAGVERVLAELTIENAPTIQVQLILQGNGCDVAVRAFGLLKVPQDRRGAMLEAINELNYSCRYVKLTLDGDCDLNAEYDLPAATAGDCLGAVCYEVYARFCTVLRGSWPILMRALWA